jgi:hypothetical protein
LAVGSSAITQHLPRANVFLGMRTATACFVALALVLCGPSGATAKKPRKTSACQKISKRYKDLATSRKLVTVVRGNDESGRVSACVLPRGKVRTLELWDDGLGRDSGGVATTAGTWVLSYSAHADQYGGVGRSLTRTNVRDGTTLSLAGYGCMAGPPGPLCPDGSDYDEAGLAPNGAGAVEVSDFAAGTTTLRAFDPRGAFFKLADGAVESLRVTSKQITWSQRGVGHAVPVPQ